MLVTKWVRNAGKSRGTAGSHNAALVRLSEAVREGEEQLRERARRALASVDATYVILSG